MHVIPALARSRAAIAIAIALLGTPALAGNDDEPVLTEDQKRARGSAEYVRLSQDLEKLASRNAWAGVERMYQAILETGIAPGFDDLVAAAYAARAVGNVTAVRDRLLAANELQEDRAVLDWLWDLDSNYGYAFIAGDVGEVTLTVDKMPFNPDQVAAIQYAQQQIETTGLYEGYLPSATYGFSGLEVRVQPRVSTVRIDVRSDGGRKRKRNKDR